MVECETTTEDSSSKTTKKNDGKERGQWGGKIFFILTAVGCAVGKLKILNILIIINRTW